MRSLTDKEQERVRRLIERYKPIAFDNARLTREENNLFQAYLSGGWNYS